ncbi:cyclic GMP-AMP synthase [Ctenopharyngodon idella]|uniref:cyclic GMP-AMP synthase n=1 Tax=Ctenopharyngodon idella TaxID=7959 RepID=UPI00222FCB22|nr:cyclic GMP-AMP synthase [Ctenopharyngodon idella]
MSSQRRQSSLRATSPDQPKAPANAKGKSKKQQRDHHNSDIEDQSPECAEDKGAPKRGSRKRQSKKEKDPRDCESEDKPHEIPAPKRGSIIRQSKKQRDPSNRDCESLEISESKSVENPSETSRSASVHNNANNAGENNRQDSAKSKRQSKKKTNPHDCESEDKPQQIQQTAKIKSGEKTAPKRQSEKQRNPSNLDREQSPESSKSKSEEKSVAKPRRLHGSAIETDFISAGNTQDARPALSARNKKSAEKTATRGLSVDDTLGRVLKETIEKLKIKKCERSNASSCVNDITDKVIAHLKRNTTWCADIESLRTGSYYENVKICEPDEFDVMLTIPVERVNIERFDEAGAFYSVALKRHPNNPLNRFLNEDKTIQASKMLSEFRDAVKEALGKLQYKIEMQRKKARCPAVTLEVTENGKTISIDFVLGLKVHRASWPDFTKDGFKIENWLGKKEKADMKRQPFYLVPKYTGKGDSEHEGVVAKDSWRISFSHVEKEILQRHGHSKTCCEAVGKKCCRKECLKLLKYLLQQLKEDDSKSNKMSNFCSYHAKTTLLHACATRGEDSQWAYSQLADCFQQLLEDFVKHLKDRHLPNFFIPSHNLLHQATPSNCDFLADEIEFQRNNIFPIFRAF